MSHPFRYIGVFVSFTELHRAIRDIRTEPLACDIPSPHVTFAYRPQEVDQALFGIPVRIRVTGYGCDGHNEGLQVQLFPSDPVLQPLIDAIPVPHITISISEDGKAVNTRYLEFAPITPFELTGFSGGYTDQGQVITTP